MIQPATASRRTAAARGVALLTTLLALGGCVGAPQAISAQPSPYGYFCAAGFYRCRLAAQYPVGSQCTCPGIGAPSYGVVSN